MAHNLSSMEHRVSTRDPENLDYYPTRPSAVRALEPVLGMRKVPFNRNMDCLEPACGGGHMVYALDEFFRGGVYAYDVHDYEGLETKGLEFHGIRSFLEEEPERKSDWIITNPPFLYVEEFVDKALSLRPKGFALFSRMGFAETQGRYKALFRNNPPAITAYFSMRAPLNEGNCFKKQGTAKFYAWFIWHENFDCSEPKTYWMDENGEPVLDENFEPYVLEHGPDSPQNVWIPPHSEMYEKPGDYEDWPLWVKPVGRLTWHASHRAEKVKNSKGEEVWVLKEELQEWLSKQEGEEE